MTRRSNITVVMATYNGSLYIEEQLKSIANQSRIPDEIVVYDDCSSDDTVEKARSVLSSYPGHVVVRSQVKNVGFNKNFEDALTLSTGDVVFFSDQDDLWLSTKVSSMVTALENSNADVVICDAGIADASGTPSGISRLSNARRAGYSTAHYVQGACTAVRREFLMKAVLPLPPGWAYDTWVHSLASALGTRVLIPQVFQYFRRHGQNATCSPTSMVHRLPKLHRIARLYRAQMHDGSGTKRKHIVAKELKSTEELLSRLAAYLNGEGRECGVEAERIGDRLDMLRRHCGLLRARCDYLALPRLRRLTQIIGEVKKSPGAGYRQFIEFILDAIKR